MLSWHNAFCLPVVEQSKALISIYIKYYDRIVNVIEKYNHEIVLNVPHFHHDIKTENKLVNNKHWIK